MNCPKLNKKGMQSLKDSLEFHLKNPEDHCLEAWAADVIQNDEDSAYVEIRSCYTKSGNPVLIDFPADECEWTA